MKRILAILLAAVLCAVLFSACGNIQNKSVIINYETGIYYNKNWNESAGAYTVDVIPNKETAIAVAEMIFETMEKSQSFNEYVPNSVFFDEPDEIWIVSFSKDSDEIILGGDCNIALQKKDGKVLRIWFGE